MKRKVTRDDLENEIVRLAIEYRSEVDRNSTLGELHFGINTVEWIFDWMKEKFPEIKDIERTTIEHLIKGTTLSDLANIAMTLLPEGATFDDGVPETDASKEEAKKVVGVYWCEEGGPTAQAPDKSMTKKEFLDMCAEYFDNRGSHFNDFAEMHIRIDAEKENV